MRIESTVVTTPKTFQVTFRVQAHCVPSKYQRRVTGWQPLYKAEWTTIAEARKSLSERSPSCTRWDSLRIVKRVHHDGQVVEVVVS